MKPLIDTFLKAYIAAGRPEDAALYFKKAEVGKIAVISPKAVKIIGAGLDVFQTDEAEEPDLDRVIRLPA